MRSITEEVLALMNEGVGSLLRTALDPHSGLQGFNFLANSVVAEVHVQVWVQLFKPNVVISVVGGTIPARIDCTPLVCNVILKIFQEWHKLLR